MNQVPADIVLVAVPPAQVDEEPSPDGRPVCDGCGQPSPCDTVSHSALREFAADFARSYSGL